MADIAKFIEDIKALNVMELAAPRKSNRGRVWRKRGCSRSCCCCRPGS